MKKLGRNDLCPCNSGKKTKYCCEQMEGGNPGANSNEFVSKPFQSALNHHRGGDLLRAERLYNEVLRLAPTHAASIHHLGLIAHQRGDNPTAINLIEKALKLDPCDAAAHNDLGLAFQADGQLYAAITAYRDALKFRPNYAQAYNNIGTAYYRLENIPTSIANYRKAISLDYKYVQAYSNLGKAFERINSPIEAANAFATALSLHDDVAARWGFARSIVLCGDTARVMNAETLLIRAISTPWARPASLSQSAIRLLKSGPLGTTISRATGTWPIRLTKAQLFSTNEFSACVSNMLLKCLLEHIGVADIEMERFLTVVRSALLGAAGEQEPSVDAHLRLRSDEVLVFACALAKQCFINGYIFDCTDEELSRIERLKDQLAVALDVKLDPPPLWLAVLAAYDTLGVLPGRTSILEREWPPALGSVIAQQILLPEAQKASKANFPKLTPISNDSQRVQTQYEESPYPVWTKLEPSAETLPINAFLRRHFPNASFTPLPEKPRYGVLIAGCGTGQQSNEAAQNYQGVDITAVDLSLSSLAYAKQKSDEYGVDNVRYMHADIMRLGEIEQRFDVIECTGVLHHLADPAAGWKILTSLLNPSGVMWIALYSEHARQSVVAARKYIKDHKYRPNLPDIRRLRQSLIATNDPQFFDVFTTPDFYAANECRDLLFHVQEHRFTIPQIKTLTASMKLKFLGFFVEPRLLEAYRRAFPKDTAATDLDNWNLFESDNPRLFEGMYQFWVQKRG